MEAGRPGIVLQYYENNDALGYIKKKKFTEDAKGGIVSMEPFFMPSITASQDLEYCKRLEAHARPQCCPRRYEASKLYFAYISTG